MAEAEAAEHGANFLTKKLGPLPVAVWIAAAGGIWWFLQKRQKPTGTGPAGQTDPAGNTGSIDPATGYVYGTPQDTSGLAAAGAVGGTTSGSGGSTVGGQYPDNDTWARAAINYLVGLGVDPTAANSAIEAFITSQQLTPQQQADVNQAIQRIGAPPSPPQPGTTPTPIVNPPSPGTVYASNPPGGITVSDKSSTSLTVKWNNAVNAQGYTVTWGTTQDAADGTWTLPGTTPIMTINGLQSNTLYYIHVQATPAKQGDPFATTSASTTGASAAPPPPSPSPSPQPQPAHHYPELKTWHTNVHDDNYTAIAQQYGTGLSGNELYQYQFTPEAGRSAGALAELRQYGPDRIYAGGSTAIPYPR
jgi:hypothetical protein